MGIVKKIKTRYGAMSLLKKYMITFVFLVFLPTVGLSGNFLVTVNNSLYTEYINKQNAILEDGFYNLNVNIDNIQRINETFQLYNTFLNYLEGYHITAADQVYAYNKDIYGIFNTSLLTNDVVEHISVYSNNDNLITIEPFIYNADELSAYNELKSLKVMEGIWKMDLRSAGRQMTYYSKLYTSNYSQELGIMKIDVSIEKLLKTLNKELYSYIIISDGEENTIIFDGDSISPIKGKALEQMDSQQEDYILSKSTLVVGDYHFEMVSHIKKTYPKTELIEAIVFIAMLLIVLAFFYLIIYRTFIKRINRLKRHLTVIENDNLIPIQNIGDMDEIGYTMMSFNQMTERINGLINEVYKKEIKRKESMYYALEAQIKPHFLYNTLECIRMMAEENCDFNVADSLYSLGHILRYTLRGDEDTILKDELVYASEYLSLYKNRMKNEFNYSINNNLKDSTIPCPKHIIQPIIENSIMHGFKNKVGGYHISLAVEEVDEGVLIRVKDNGEGISVEKINVINEHLGSGNIGDVLKTSNSIGLDNVNDRIKMFFGDGSGIYLKNNTESSGLTIVIKLLNKI
ncbi:sensor histidine kinase [Vallitalea okinawensis]|uniref:sensor histidine kinase n=1 Tax=Vallitalea okinawensis TaxID=2078660 RepID=UPI000CFBB42A|nr:histidine kinase [Vallitalea okinawensis]